MRSAEVLLSNGTDEPVPLGTAKNESDAWFLKSAHQKQNQYDDKNQPKPAAGCITPALAMRPRWKGSHKQENEDDE